MKENATMTELCSKLVQELKRLHYTEGYIKRFEVNAKEFQTFCSLNFGTDVFSEDAGSMYLKSTYNYVWGDAVSSTPHATQDAIRCIKVLGELNQYGALLTVKKNTDISLWALKDACLVNSFLLYMQSAHNSERTKESRLYRLRLFYRFVGFKGLESVLDIDTQVIRDYVLSLQGYSLAYTRNRLVTLKQYLSFLYKRNLIDKDYTECIPRIIIPENQNLPNLWEKSDIEKLLQNIDRSSPSGIRCYAMLLLAIQLGMRISDISNLKFENLKWESKKIEFIQCKTGERNSLPMLDDVGWALIDYIRYARPKIESPYVFLYCCAPYKNIAPDGVGSVLQRHLRRCGIQKKIGIVSGMHSFRHALARRLLENGTQLSEISEILGHREPGSTSTYLSVDIEGMRKCALSLNEVTIND